jgi:hypothetical protein
LLLTKITPEQKTSFLQEVHSILIASGFQAAKQTRITRGNMTTRISITGGFTFAWSANSLELVITRWAEGDVFATSKKSNAVVYAKSLVAAGFSVEQKEKQLVVTGKASA